MKKRAPTCLLALAVLGAGCRRAALPADAGTRALPSIAIAPSRTDLVFSWVDGDGKFHDATKAGDVPKDRRRQVLVRDLSKRPDEVQADEYLFVADLSVEPDGGYPYAIVSRYGFDRSLKARVFAGELDAVEEQTSDGGGTRGGLVLYGTSWCGACAAARQFFAERNIPFADKDIEKDPKAQAELLRKARKAGVDPSGVPVIDVRGTLVTGFDAEQLERMLKGT